jgi:light-harvesting complex II chlorophyll a/b binding protein 4
VPKLPDIPGAKLFEQQFVPEYLKSSPPYLTGAFAGDIGFDPWCLVALAKPTKENAMEFDKNLRTAEARKQKMLSMSEEEQAETVAWMRNAEIKHARLAMLAAAGWPLAELANGQSMRFATNGRAPSLFNGHLLDFWPALLIVFGGLSYLELTTKDKIKDGDFGFDPLGIASGKGPVGGSGQPIFDSLPDSIPNIGDMEALKLAELKNGRAAMMAITGFAVQEFFWGKPVTELTPIFF